MSTDTVAPAEKQEDKAEVRPSMQELLNNIKMEGVIFANGISLGDALETLANAISRSGETYGLVNGQDVREKGVNKELGTLLIEMLRRTPRAIRVIPTSFGWDPHRPMFVEGEAVELPINATMLMLLPKSGPRPPSVPVGDNPNQASPIAAGR